MIVGDFERLEICDFKYGVLGHQSTKIPLRNNPQKNETLNH